MKKSLQFFSFCAILALLATLPACSGKANNTASPASNKFLGTWKAAPESEADFKGGPITFKEDFTYSAQKTNDPTSSIVTGPYTISKDEKLFLGGELEKFGKEGMKFDAEGRLRLTKGDRTFYLVKSQDAPR